MEGSKVLTTSDHASTNLEGSNNSRFELVSSTRAREWETPSPKQLRLTLTVEEAAETLGLSRAFAYDAVRRGEIPSIRIGRRILIPKKALERLLGSSQ